MLKELHRVVPNINPDLRVLGGFSNGGHCIDGCMRGAREYFDTFIIADGGGTGPGGYPLSRGCYMFVCWGSKSPAKMYVPTAAKMAARAGMKVTSVEMRGEGHEFPGEYQQKVHEWMETVVIPAVAKSRSCGRRAR
jgi:predicted esterase